MTCVTKGGAPCKLLNSYCVFLLREKEPSEGEGATVGPGGCRSHTKKVEAESMHMCLVYEAYYCM